MAHIAQRQDPTDELYPLEDRNPFRFGLLSMDPQDFADNAELEAGVLPRRLQGQSGN
jgi:hypothetical protein